MSHDIQNEQIATMDQCDLCSLLRNTKAYSPTWYSIIADEVTIVCNPAQFNLSIQWVNNYLIHEDPVGLFYHPDTMADTKC